MANFLDNFFKSLGGNNSSSVLGIDIGSSSIKVVQLKKKKGRAILQTYGEIALGPYDQKEIGRATKLGPEKIVEALIDVLKESKVSTPDCALSIPMQSSMVSVINMPLIKNNQLAQMIPIEARKYIPVPIQEVTMDWFVVPNVEESETNRTQAQKFQEVMIVAIHNDVLNNFSRIVSASKVNANFFEVEMFSTSRAVLEGTYLSPVVIIDIGAGASKVYITERGVIRDSHIINKGSQDITLNLSKTLGVSVDFAEKLKRNLGRNELAQDQAIGEITDIVMEPVFGDIQNFILRFQKKENKIIGKVILTGGGSLLPGLVEKAQKKFGIETHLANPFSKVETPAFLSSILQKTGLIFSSAIGLALRKLQELE